MLSVMCTRKVAAVLYPWHDQFLTIHVTLLCIPILTLHHSMNIGKIMHLVYGRNNLKFPHPKYTKSFSPAFVV